MKRWLFMILAALPSLALAQMQPPENWNLPNAGPNTGIASFNIADYGAKCNGVTNDDQAINKAVTTARLSAAYQNSNAVLIIGPQGSMSTGCVINSINATGFTKGSGANLRPRVTFRDMTLLCTGAGNVCFDALGSSLIKMENVSIRGDNVSPPEICIQVGVINANSAAWNSFDHVNCNNDFTFTDLYNFGSESNTYYDSMFANAHSSSGPIGTFGSIVGGSGYTNGTYNNTPLTGGSGTGALANIAVSSGIVSSVTMTYEGRDYMPGDILSASLPGGQGFSVPVATVAPYVVVMDGQNHWRALSAFVTETLPVETWQSLTLNTFYNSHVRQLASGGALWLGWTGGLRMINSYILNTAGMACITLFDNGVTKTNLPAPNWGLDLNLNCEGSISAEFRLTGSHSTPLLFNMKYRGYNLASAATFITDSNITAVTAQNADFDILFSGAVAGGAPLFASPGIWTLSGHFAVPAASYWTAPASINGSLMVGGQATFYGTIN